MKIPKLKEEYYTAKAFYELFSISPATYYRHKRKGRMPKLCSIGGKAFISRKDIIKWLKEKGFEVEA